MSIVLHFKHVCLALAEDSPSKAKVQHVDVPPSNAENTDDKDGELTDPTQRKRKNNFINVLVFITLTSA